MLHRSAPPPAYAVTLRRIRCWLEVAIACALVAAFFGTTGVATGTAAEPESDEYSAPMLVAIEIEGNQHTSTALIEREIGLKIGEPFPEERIDPIWDHLEDLGYFAFVDLEYDETAPGEVVLRVVVQEDKTLHFGPVIEYSDRQKYVLGGWLDDRNFRGEGEILAVRALAYRIQQLSVGWTRPWFLNVENLELELAVTGEQGGFVWRATDYRQLEAKLGSRYDFQSPFFADAAARYRVFDQRDAFSTAPPPRGPDTVSGDVNHPAQIRHAWLLGGGVGYDTRSNPYYPIRGLYLRLGGVWNAQNDVASFAEWTGDARVFLNFYRQTVLALRAYGRKLTAAAPIEDRLYWGGAESVRGYNRDTIEGETGYLLSVEYRVPLFLMPISPRGELVGFGLHAFADAGDAWYDGAKAGEAARSWGVGAHINLTSYQFRFEAANTAEGDWRFQFMDHFNF
jgi:outer membrane protein assembly factor BamA